MNRLAELYLKKYGRKPNDIKSLRSDGSDRKIYRVSAGEHTVIGILGSDYHENAAFLEFSRHFRQAGLRVPEIYIQDSDENDSRPRMIWMKPNPCAISWI